MKWFFADMGHIGSILLSFLLFVSPVTLAQETYEYIVVGSGPGGGPLAANLARAGHSVLLLEAGDDQGDNTNSSVLANFNKAGNDPSTRWDFFVRHSDDPEAQLEYKHLTWRQTNGSFYVGLDPPEGAEQLGIYYPRAGTLGGCAMHNAGIVSLPADWDWNHYAELTGDQSWDPSNMRKYYERLERCLYLPEGTPGHGFDGYLNISQGQSSWAQEPSDMRTLAELGVSGLGQDPANLQTLLERDMNAPDPTRDTTTGVFGSLSHADNEGMRSSANGYIRDTVNDATANYPLTVQMNSLVTKVLMGESSPPTAVGVEYLQGKSLYSADPRSNPDEDGKVAQAFASKEVILSGGVFNTPQILKLSGIGPAEELQSFDIPSVVDLPAVGSNMADNYEAGLLGLAARDLDPSIGMFHAFLQTSAAQHNMRDIHTWCGSFSFEGFWPGFPNDYGPRQYECATVHMHPRSQAGTVKLRSSDPRDTPDINMRFFEGDGADKDLQALLESVQWARQSIFDQAPDGVGPFEELHPCESADCTTESQKEYLRLQVYSHHATSTCRIGGDNDAHAVLDSKFRVRGVQRLRVVDASAFPNVPGAFPVISTFTLAEKATDEILADAGKA